MNNQSFSHYLYLDDLEFLAKCRALSVKLACFFNIIDSDLGLLLYTGHTHIAICHARIQIVLSLKTFFF